MDNSFRVFLRKPVIEDSSEFLRLMKSSSEQLEPWVYPPLKIEEYSAYLERIKCEHQEGFFICLQTTGEIIGVMNISEIVRGGFQNAFLGFYLGAPFMGRGYMSEALHLTLDHAFNTMQLHRLEANIQPGNAKSINLVKKCGFSLEGFSPRYLKIGDDWKDHQRWAIIAENWGSVR